MLVEGDQARDRPDRASRSTELGDIVFVELPAVGATLTQFASFGVVESVKAVSDVYAPVERDRGRGQRDAPGAARVMNRTRTRRGGSAG